MNKLCFIILSALLVFSGCKEEVITPMEQKKFTFDFNVHSEGWIGDFADYPNDPNVEDFYELEFSHSTLPSPLRSSEGALKQSGNNHSDDLFMFIKRKLTGLDPNTNYNIDIEIEFATNAASGGAGVGGAPGEGVAIKAGASPFEPMKMIDNSDNWYRMNIDKGNQQIGGNDMKKIGDFSNGTDLSIYKLKILKTTSPVNVSSNSNGEVWIIVGTDSGFEATTTIYYNRIAVNVK